MQRSATMSSKRNTVEFTREFQENAVRLTRLKGRTIASVSEELKIPAWKLREWIQESKQKLEKSSELNELLKLYNENKRLKEENEILKKAAAYFAKTLR
jgi:transposase